MNNGRRAAEECQYSLGNCPYSDFLVSLEMGTAGADGASNESEKDKEIEELSPSKVQYEDGYEKRGEGLTNGTDAIDESSGAPVQLFWDGVENGHGGHKDIGAIDKDSGE